MAERAAAIEFIKKSFLRNVVCQERQQTFIGAADTLVLSGCASYRRVHCYKRSLSKNHKLLMQMRQEAAAAIENPLVQ